MKRSAVEIVQEIEQEIEQDAIERQNAKLANVLRENAEGLRCLYLEEFARCADGMYYRGGLDYLWIIALEMGLSEVAKEIKAMSNGVDQAAETARASWSCKCSV